MASNSDLLYDPDEDKKNEDWVRVGVFSHDVFASALVLLRFELFMCYRLIDIDDLIVLKI